MSIYLTVAAVSYLLGSIPFGYILVRAFLKTDIRQTGSGNIGATNVGRTGHKGLAIATLLLDAGKGALSVWLAITVAKRASQPLMNNAEDAWAWYLGHIAVFAAFAALFAVLGHVFPVWLKFKGGKGVATAVGAFALLSPRAVLIALGVFLVTLALTRFVSLGSILGSIAFPVAVYLLPSASYWDSDRMRLIAFVATTAALVILKHHANIRRLIAGTEPKLGAKSAPPSNSLPTERHA